MNWTTYLSRLEIFIHQHQLIPPNSSVLVAVSGGIDSVLLFRGIAALHKRLQLNKWGAVYVDHGVRPEQTPQEAEFVLQLAEQYGATGYVRTITVDPARASFQDAARIERRSAIESICTTESWDRIATGHHRDDQAETLMIRLLRGTSTDGLAGITPRAGRWIHPLLPFSRKELNALAEQEEIRWMEDPSNATSVYLRNRIRHQLIPQLEEEYNPQLRAQWARLAEQAHMDEVYFQEQLNQVFQEPLIRRTDRALHIHLQHWSKLPDALRWRCIKKAIHAVYGQSLPLQQIEQLLQLTRRYDGEKSISLPQPFHVVRRYEQLILMDPIDAASFIQSTQGTLTPKDCIEVHQPGHYTSPWGTLVVTEHLLQTHECAVREDNPVRKTTHTVFLPTPLEGPLLLRTRRPGDRIRLKVGHRLLKKWMIDEKIPRSQRLSIPLIEYQEVIGWIIGQRYNPPFQWTPTSPSWKLEFFPLDTVQNENQVRR